MSKIRVETSSLVDMLRDLVQTAGESEDGAIGGVLVHVDRGYPGVEPGKTTMLVGTSTTGRTIGHTYTWCTGTMSPTLWPIDDVMATIAVLRPLTRKTDPKHAVEIRCEDGKVVIAEDPDLFGDRLTLSFKAGDLADYPRRIWHLLTEIHVRPAVTDNGVSVPARPRTDIPPAGLVPFQRVATRRKAVVEIYRYHQRLPVLIQIGSDYRGAVLPTAWPDGADGTGPDADVYAPELPPPELPVPDLTNPMPDLD